MHKASYEDLDGDEDNTRDCYDLHDHDDESGVTNLCGDLLDRPRDVADDLEAPRRGLSAGVGDDRGVLGIADAKVGTDHNAHCQGASEPSRGSIVPSGFAKAEDERYDMENQVIECKGIIVDDINKKDDERYHRDRVYHSGDYKADDVWDRKEACTVDSLNPARSGSLNDDDSVADVYTTSRTRHGDHCGTAPVQDNNYGGEGPEDYHDDADLDGGSAHPFSLPPEEDEQGDLYVGELQDEAQRASSSGDPCPEARHGNTGPAMPRRRLTGKTSPSRAAELGHSPHAADPQPGEGLVTREVARAARCRQREAAEAHGRASKVARTTAWLAIRRQPEIATVVHGEEPTDQVAEDTDGVPVDGADGFHIPHRWRAHLSHDISAAPGAHLIFCKRCGTWSLGERSTNLMRPCTMKMGHKGNLRLLSLGIAPRRGARVPAELKKAGARGTRGGLVVRRSSKRRGWR